MSNVTDDEDARRKAEAEKEWAEAKAEKAAALRAMCDVLMFWRSCSSKACLRGRKCTGDAYACFDRGWSLTSDIRKELVRGYIRAAAAGAAPQDAWRTAQEWLVHYYTTKYPHHTAEDVRRTRSEEYKRLNYPISPK